MGDLIGLQNLSGSDMLVLVLGLPYVLIALGRLVPYRHVKDWRDAYFESERARERGVAAMERGADALTATNEIVQATLAPIREAGRDGSSS